MNVLNTICRFKKPKKEPKRKLKRKPKKKPKRKPKRKPKKPSEDVFVLGPESRFRELVHPETRE